MNLHLFYSSVLSIALSPVLLLAQSNRRPIVDITTNPQSWSDNQANICTQIMTIPRISVCVSADFRAVEKVQGHFLTQSSEWGILSEIRFFPFGESRPLLEKNKEKKAQKGPNKTACFSFASTHKQGNTSLGALLRGLYIAPGFVYREQQLTFFIHGEESSGPNFKYGIKSKGGTLALGYQIRLTHLTIGAGWVVEIIEPRWSGPVDIFGDSLYTTTYPWKLNIQDHLRFEVGINF